VRCGSYQQSGTDRAICDDKAHDDRPNRLVPVQRPMLQSKMRPSSFSIGVRRSPAVANGTWGLTG
jgi:hypothetical protein